MLTFPQYLVRRTHKRSKGQTGRLTSGRLLTVNSDEWGRAGFYIILLDMCGAIETCGTPCLKLKLKRACSAAPLWPPPPPAPSCSLGRLHGLHLLTLFRLRLCRAFRYTYPYLPILKSSGDVGGEAHHAWRGLGRIGGGYFMDYTWVSGFCPI